jgi:hypothetical protein
MPEQSLLNTKNFNIANINNNNQTLDLLSNVIINNSIKISRSVSQTNNLTDNANAAIFIKDASSYGQGTFYSLIVNSAEYTVPSLYFNSNVVIDKSNLLSELEDILNDYPLETSNIVVKGGYINFWNGIDDNNDIGDTGVGLRYSSTSNTVQFKNWDTDWIDLVDITKHDQFSELIDVDVDDTNPLYNNQYIIYNATTEKYTNSNLAIINDTSPELGGNLTVGSYTLSFSTNTTKLIYDNSETKNTLIQFQNNSTITGNANYLEIANTNTEGITNPSITCQGTLDDIGITIVTKGTGDILLNASTGNVYTNSDSLVVDGFIRNSIYRTSTKSGGYTPETSWTIPLTNDIFLFDFSVSATTGTYYANVSAGIDGQKINFIFNNKSSNPILVIIDFGTNGLLVGTGYSNALVFSITGQSTSLVYLGEGIDAWQVLNSGCSDIL